MDSLVSLASMRPLSDNDDADSTLGKRNHAVQRPMVLMPKEDIIFTVRPEHLPTEGRRRPVSVNLPLPVETQVKASEGAAQIGNINLFSIDLPMSDTGPENSPIAKKRRERRPSL